MPPTRARVNPGRLGAARALLAVEEGGHAEDALARFAPADSGDRALAWHLVLGVLRHRNELDSVIAAGARRPIRALDPPVRAVLRLGVFELRYSRTPPHAAVDQAVECVRAVNAGYASGLVNAVLRHQSEHTPPADALLNHPDWLMARWRKRYGADADRWMRANNEPAVTTIVAKEDAAGLARALQHAGKVALAVGSDIFQVEGAVDALPGYAEGRFWVMDAAALAVADLVPADGSVLDACAAPGGKAFRLTTRGAAVTATDVDDARLARVREGAERLGLTIATSVHDWTLGPLVQAPGAPPALFDAVLVDAPCSALGLLRRHPDIRWTRRESDPASLARKQAVMLSHAATCVRPGGALVYAVCSPEPEEGEAVVRSIGWPIEETFANAPCTEGHDAFYACRMRRPSA